MSDFDFPISELQQYKPKLIEPADFDEFWQSTLHESSQRAFAPIFTPVDLPLIYTQVYDVTFSGFGGQPVKGWLIMPKECSSPQPCIMECAGYGGGRGNPLDWMHWIVAGFSTFVFDTRGQGGDWLSCDTPDLCEDAGEPHSTGVFTLGISSPSTYYYRRLITDAFRGLETVRNHPLIDSNRIALAGFSQGAGVALAIAGLDQKVTALLADMPFLCDFPRAVAISDERPYAELVAWLRLYGHKEKQALATLSYFDGVFFAKRAKAPAMFATGLMDTVCPPSTVFAAYNHYSGEKSMRVFPWHQHQSVGAQYRIEQMHFLNKVLRKK